MGLTASGKYAPTHAANSNAIVPGSFGVLDLLTAPGRLLAAKQSYLDPRVSHEPRYSDIGPSPKFAINAAPSRSTEKVNAIRFRHMPAAYSFLFAYTCISSHDRSRAKMISGMAGMTRSAGQPEVPY